MRIICPDCGEAFEALQDRRQRCLKCRAGAKQYRMQCCQCGKLYDGRLGPWIGLCSLGCVGAFMMGQAAGAMVAARKAAQ